MAEPLHTGAIVALVTGAATAVGAGLVGVFKWLLSREVKRNDARHDMTSKTLEVHDTRLDTLERTMVTKVDLEQAERRISAAIRDSGNHMAERIGDVKATADKAHDRLDRLPRA